MGVGKKYVDETCTKLNAEFNFSGHQSWFRVDVPRSGDGKHSDPYWFHPHGFRFRSIREIDRWRESGWDLNALPKTAFQEKKTDGLGISREGAIANNVLTRENLEAIKQQGSTVAVGDSTSRKRTSGAGEDGDGTGVSMKRRRQGPTYVPKSAEGLSLFTKCKEKECFRTITALAPQTVCSIYQKMTWIGDLALTHIIGVDMRCVLPKDIFVFQRTVYDAIKTFCVPPFEQLALQTDGSGLTAPFDSGCVMIARCEVRATTRQILPLIKRSTLTESSSVTTSGGAEGADPLDTFFNVLNARFRVGFCQTLDNNNQIYLVPKFKPTSSSVDVVSLGQDVASLATSSSSSSSSSSLVGSPTNLSLPVPATSSSSAEDTLWKLIGECENASSIPLRGTEDAFLVILLRNLDGPTLCTTIGVGELTEAQLSAANVDPTSPPSRETRIPIAPSVEEWARENPERVSL